ncbi:MAG: 5'-3' exonuclease H3TH domain-containing protein [Patescibacteria group bacterium]
MKKLVLIDSNAVIHRAYHALPKSMSTRKGEQTNAVYGFTTTLIKTLEDLHPDYVAASFDVSKATFRTEQYAAYKATRVKADQELYDQMPRVKELLSAFEIPIYEKEGYEADDCIGTIVKNCHEHNSKCQHIPNEGLEVYIVSGDKDIYQLIDGNIFVYSLRKGLSQMAVVDRKVIKDEYGLDPEDFIDLKALAGDPSDNIPGVPNIGNVTATKLLQQFDTLKNLYEKIEKNIVISTPQPCLRAEKSSNKRSLDYARDDNSEMENDKLVEAAKKLNIKPRILQLLIQYKEQAFLSQSLATIYKEVPIDFDLNDAKWGEYDKEKVKELFLELGFHSLLKRFGIEKSEPPKTKEASEQKQKDEQLKLL